MIFDTHCHLNDVKLFNDLDNVLERAKEVGVSHFLVVGWDKKSSELAISLAESYPFIFATVGYHPENIFDVSEEEFLSTMELAKHPKVVAIGEIGLDYHWSKEEVRRRIQKEFFIKQIEYANKLKKPISIHNRDAFEDCINILKEHKPMYGGVMHCYSGSVEAIKEVISLGLFISLGGPLTFTNAKTTKQVAINVPLEYLVVETDCPYLSPHPLRGTINEPANICWIIDEISRLRNMSKKHLMDTLFKNSCVLFHV